MTICVAQWKNFKVFLGLKIKKNFYLGKEINGRRIKLIDDSEDSGGKRRRSPSRSRSRSRSGSARRSTSARRSPSPHRSGSRSERRSRSRSNSTPGFF